MAEFKGKVALVAGNLGKIKKDKFKIGLSGVIAQKLIKNGCKVCIVDTDYKIAKACAEEINNENVKARKLKNLLTKRDVIKPKLSGQMLLLMI